MLSLTALASWEETVLASIAGATGSIEERDAQITRSGMYAEYPAIFAAYLEVVMDVDDPAISLEALKRGVFIAWYGSQAAPTTSGIAELPETSVRQLMDSLGDAIVAGEADDELRRMLAWYHARFGYLFEHFGPVRGLASLIAGVSPSAAASLAATPGRFVGRGQLGRFWSAMKADQR